MNRQTWFAVCLTAAMGGAALASEPGQPLDCSDWVFAEPGFTCTTRIPFPCVEDSDVWPVCTGSENAQALDNLGRHYYLRDVPDVRVEPCGGIDRLELVRVDGDQGSVVAYLEDRCDGPRKDGTDLTPTNSILFDDKGGQFLLPIRSTCAGPSCGYQPGYWVAALGGFTTTLELLQTYDPPSVLTILPFLRFRVPYMPEGFAAADSFDSYYGQLTRPLDLSQALPLRCGYPAAAPATGDAMSYQDTTTPPAPGEATYFLTAVNFQGQKRAGRESSTGTLRGRDASLLPPCSAAGGGTGS